jgi:hypothetical protein
MDESNLISKYSLEVLWTRLSQKSEDRLFHFILHQLALPCRDQYG